MSISVVKLSGADGDKQVQAGEEVDWPDSTIHFPKTSTPLQLSSWIWEPFVRACTRPDCACERSWRIHSWNKKLHLINLCLCTWNSEDFLSNIKVCEWNFLMFKEKSYNRLSALLGCVAAAECFWTERWQPLPNWRVYLNSLNFY